MTSPVERRYRHVLRLLPAGYRADWEEDMVTAYMEGAPSGRPALGERLSVVLLAVRLRLNGSHATPRGLVGYRAVHAIALMVLLYQAIAATVAIAILIEFLARVGMDAPLLLRSFFAWSQLFGLLWVAAFGCFVAGRFVAARIVVLLAAASAIGIVVTTIAIAGVNRAPMVATDVTRWVWLALSVVVVFVTPSGARAPRRLWAGAYLVGALVAVSFAIAGPLAFPVFGWWFHVAGVAQLAMVGLIAAMAVLLVTTRSAHWLVALAVTAGGLGGVHLLSSQLLPWLRGGSGDAWPLDALEIALVILAGASLAVGVFQWRRVPAR